MRKFLASILFLGLLSQDSTAQNKNDNIRPTALGVSFFFNDFITAQRIRDNSFSGVLKDDQWAKFNEMSPGLAITYFKGLEKYLDFAGTLAASFVNYPLQDGQSFSSDAFFLEIDASVNLKLFPESYWFTPYLSAGIGASKYRDLYGGFIPLGGGLKVNFFDEATFFVNTQYRIPVSEETTNYHLMYSFGVSSVIGK